MDATIWIAIGTIVSIVVVIFLAFTAENRKSKRYLKLFTTKFVIGDLDSYWSIVVVIFLAFTAENRKIRLTFLITLCLLSFCISAQKQKAYFASGCFWCVEAIFETIPGVVNATSGYCGGETENPTYRDICSGLTGHAETVEVTFIEKNVSYETLLEVFLPPMILKH